MLLADVWDQTCTGAAKEYRTEILDNVKAFRADPSSPLADTANCRLVQVSEVYRWLLVLSATDYRMWLVGVPLIRPTPGLAFHKDSLEAGYGLRTPLTSVCLNAAGRFPVCERDHLKMIYGNRPYIRRRYLFRTIDGPGWRRADLLDWVGASLRPRSLWRRCCYPSSS